MERRTTKKGERGGERGENNQKRGLEKGKEQKGSRRIIKVKRERNILQVLERPTRFPPQRKIAPPVPRSAGITITTTKPPFLAVPGKVVLQDATRLHRRPPGEGP